MAITAYDKFSAWMCLWQFESLKWCDPVECRQLSFPPLATVTQFVLLWVFWVHSCLSQNHHWRTGTPSPMVTPTVTLHTHTAWTESTQICVTVWRVFVQKNILSLFKTHRVFWDETSSHLPILQKWTILPNACAACDLWNLYKITKEQE